MSETLVNTKWDDAGITSDTGRDKLISAFREQLDEVHNIHQRQFSFDQNNKFDSISDKHNNDISEEYLSRLIFAWLSNG